MCSGLAGNGVMGEMLGQSGVTGFVKDVLPIASWVAQPFMLGAGSGAGEAGWVSAEGGTGYAAGAATDAAAAGGTAAVADGAAADGAGVVYGDGGASETIPPLQDAGTGQVATDAGAGAGAGAQSPDYLKKAKDALALAGAAAGVVKALTPTPTPPTAPAAAPPPQSAQSADISAILKKNSLLFGGDSPAGTDLTNGRASTGNLGRVSLLGGTSKLGG